jgi:hypothetical protein
MNAIELIDKWYAKRCNGDWENHFGITISTTDNPGWLIAIDQTISNEQLSSYSASIKKWNAECIFQDEKIKVFAKTLADRLAAAAHILENAH